MKHGACGSSNKSRFTSDKTKLFLKGDIASNHTTQNLGGPEFKKAPETFPNSRIPFQNKYDFR